MKFYGRVFAGILLALTAFVATFALRDTPIPEEKETLIQCELEQGPRLADAPVFTSQQEADGAKGTYHYKLWLPKGYHAQPLRRWPCIFVVSPIGGKDTRFDATMQACLASNYVIVMLVESHNGPIATSLGNFLAAHDDVISRFRIQEGQKLITGLSGGAQVSSVLVQMRPGFCGLIMQGAASLFERFWLPGHDKNTNLYTAMTVGDLDPRNRQVDYMKLALGSAHFKVFLGGGEPEWAPTSVFAQALGWIEQQTDIGPALAPPDKS